MPRVYDRQDWRKLPRVGECAGIDLLGGECAGSAHLHHIDGTDDRLLLLCARHHALLHGARQRALGWKQCPHRPGTHRYPGAREACERRLNNTA